MLSVDFTWSEFSLIPNSRQSKIMVNSAQLCCCKRRTCTRNWTFNRVIKERTRCYYAMLPFDTVSRIMVIHLLVTVMFYINMFVWKKRCISILKLIDISRRSSCRLQPSLPSNIWRVCSYLWHYIKHNNITHSGCDIVKFHWWFTEWSAIL